MVCSQCGTQNENSRDVCVRCKGRLHPAMMKGKIACYIHANREATTSCASCGTRMCESCAVYAGEIAYCDACAPANAVRRSYDEDYEKIPVVDPSKTPVASFDARFLAAGIDVAIFFAGLAIVGFAFFLFTGSSDFFLSLERQTVGWWLYRALIAVAIPLYLIFPHAMTGQTPGKQLSRVIVLQPDGHIITTRAAVIRGLGLILSALPLGLGFAWAIWDKEKRTWHDKMADTVVYEYNDLT